MAIGPIQLFVIGFPSNEFFDGSIIDELNDLRSVGAIRVIDSIFVMNEGGEHLVARASDLTDAQREELGAVVGALIGLGAAGPEGFEVGAQLGAERAASGDSPVADALIEEMIEDLPDGSSGLVLVLEHRWAIPLRNAVRNAGGIVLAARSVTAERLVALGVALADDEDEEL